LPPPIVIDLRNRVQVTGYLSQAEIVNILNSTEIALAIYSEGPQGPRHFSRSAVLPSMVEHRQRFPAHD
jgi:hypothetical protein